MAGLVKYLYSEAKKRIQNTVNVQISADGFQTPLGALTLEQIEKGEDILLEAHELFKSKKKLKSSAKAAKIMALTNEFYSAIPHKLGRARGAVAANKLDNANAFAEKQETLQLMKDMLQVNSNAKEGNNVSVLTDDALVGDQYEALGMHVEFVKKSSGEYKNLVKEIKESVARSHEGTPPGISRVFKVRRAEEIDKFTDDVGNEVLLYHGSRACNWVGILSRGLLLPKIVVNLGGSRTDGGWLGDGIYFGEADAASGYAQAGDKNTAFFLVARYVK